VAQALPGLARWGSEPDGRAATVLLVVSGVLLALGLITPVAAGTIAVVQTSHALGWMEAPADGPLPVLPVIVSVAVVLLGPGAFAIDARLFGRREIVIPHDVSRRLPTRRGGDAD
jgi:uncharacterized membrane protein YphA (DoxX/SURF4 family)